MAVEKKTVTTKKPVKPDELDFGKPKNGYFRVVKTSWVGKMKDRRIEYYTADIVNKADCLGDKDDSLLEVYKRKVKDPQSNVFKVIE